MADNVQWIKLKVGMFDGSSFKKIKRAMIGGVSYRDKLTSVWFELMDLAGKSNASGCLIDNNEIPYHTFEDIAIMIDREPEEVELCMQFFIKERMVEIIDNIYCLSNFEKYQCVEGLEKIREQKRISQAKWRERKAQGLIGKSNVDSTVESTEHLLSISISNSKSNDYKEIVDYLNNKINASYKYTTKKTQQLISARKKEGFGVDEFKKVIDNMFNKWNGTEYEQYLRPETLFGTKFEGYLNQQPTRQTQTHPVKKYGDGSAYDYED